MEVVYKQQKDDIGLTGCLGVFCCRLLLNVLISAALIPKTK